MLIALLAQEKSECGAELNLVVSHDVRFAAILHLVPKEYCLRPNPFSSHRTVGALVMPSRVYLGMSFNRGKDWSHTANAKR
jgi:hypothetical protein